MQFLLQCSWRFKSSGMWWYVIGVISSKISEDHNAIIFRFKQSKKYIYSGRSEYYYISTNTSAGKRTMWVTGQWRIYHPIGLKLTWPFCLNNKLLSPHTPTSLFSLYGSNVLPFLTECCHKSQMLLEIFFDNNDTLSNEWASLKD